MVLSEWFADSVLGSFLHLLDACPNLHTLNVFYAHEAIHIALKDTLNDRRYASIRALIIPLKAYPLVACCPNLRRLFVTQAASSQSSKYIKTIVEAAPGLEDIRFLRELEDVCLPSSFRSLSLTVLSVVAPSTRATILASHRPDLFKGPKRRLCGGCNATSTRDSSGCLDWEARNNHHPARPFQVLLRDLARGSRMDKDHYPWQQRVMIIDTATQCYYDCWSLYPPASSVTSW